MTILTIDRDEGRLPPGPLPRWFLIALLYADGQLVKEISLQLSLTEHTVKDYLKIAKGHLLGVAYRAPNGRGLGIGTRLDLRAALVADEFLTE